MLVYLAGAMEHSPDGGSTWRRELTPFITETLGHRVFDPCIEELLVLSDEERANFREWKISAPHRFRKIMDRIIRTDLTTVLRSAYLVCLWDEYASRGGGTHGELTVAKHNHIPVYMVSTVPLEEMSSWIVGCTTEFFENFKELRDFLHVNYAR